MQSSLLHHMGGILLHNQSNHLDHLHLRSPLQPPSLWHKLLLVLHYTKLALCVIKCQCIAPVFNSSSFSWIIFQFFFLFIIPLSIVSSTNLISRHLFSPCSELKYFLMPSQHCHPDETPKLPSTTQIISSLAELLIINFQFIPYYLKVFY